MAKAKPLPDIAYLQECVIYEPDTGVLRWRERPRRHFHEDQTHQAWNTKFAGKAAGCLAKDGYLRISIGNLPYPAHRIIWLMLTGEQPEQIDHRNLNRSNNRLENLRAAPSGENHHNVRKLSTNTSGFKGVCWHSNTQKWLARIYHAGKAHHLGLYSTPEAAHAAYCEASARLHREFGRTS